MVYAGTDKESKKMIAIKISNLKVIKSVVKEAKILSILRDI